MKKTTDDKADRHAEDWEPPWMNPAHDRTKPYTEDELELFAEAFVTSVGDTEKMKTLLKEEGIDKVKETVKEAFRRQDERNLLHIVFNGSIH